MAIQTGQRTSENSSDVKAEAAAARKRSEASKKAARTKKRNAAKSQASSPRVPKSKQGKAREFPDNPFTDEKVEIYGLLEADVERRENRAPAADPIKTVTVGKDGVLKVDGLERGSYLAYSPERNVWLGFQVT